MPIAEFYNSKELEDWVAECATPLRYVVFATADKRVILKPTKATSTLDYGCYCATTKEKQEEAIAKLMEAGYQVVKFFAYHWDVEKFGNSSG